MLIGLPAQSWLITFQQSRWKNFTSACRDLVFLAYTPTTMGVNNATDLAAVEVMRNYRNRYR